MTPVTAKKPRNYAATESTLIHNRKTRKDIAALKALVGDLRRRMKRIETALYVIQRSK